MAKFTPPFAYDGERRSTTSDEQEHGIPCGPFDRPMWHGLFHNVQAELGNLISASGQTDSEKDLSQVARAVQSGKVNYAVAGGTADALTVTLTPAPAALTPGMMIRVKVTAPNTGMVTLDVNGLGVRDIVYNATGEKLLGKDFAAGEILHLVFDGTNWRIHLTLGLLDGRYSKLSAPPANNFYVVGSAGNDANSGLAPTAKEGFATIQGAVDVISSRYLTAGTVTIYVSDGNYGGFTIKPSFISSWRIVGNQELPDRVKINSLSLSVNDGRGAMISGARVTIIGLEFASYYENIAHSGSGTTDIGNCNIQLPVGAGSAIGCYGGRMFIWGTFKISGIGESFIAAAEGGSVVIAYQDAVVTNKVWFNYQNPTFRGGNIVASRGGSVSVTSSVVIQQGAASGPRFLANSNGVIFVSGSGVNFFFGTAPGSTSSGGQYL